MSVDDLLFIVIIGGLVLSIAYLRAQYSVRRSQRIAERGNELLLRELYGARPNARDPLKNLVRPVSCGAAPHLSLNAVLHGSLPVHVRVVYPARQPARHSESAEVVR
jgi:hypothetical protein